LEVSVNKRKNIIDEGLDSDWKEINSKKIEENVLDQKQNNTGTQVSVKETCDSNPEAVKSKAEKKQHEMEVKIADLGNACWVTKHFTDDVTTREYRSPEVLVGVPYSTPIDVWSVACLIFELVTGDYLFKPKDDSNGEHSRDEDHLALMSELLGKIPKRLTATGKFSKYFFNRKGEFRNIKNLDTWPLLDVLCEKYKMEYQEALELTNFLLPMLNMEPNHRATASDMLQHPWLIVTENSIPDRKRNEITSPSISSLGLLKEEDAKAQTLNHELGGSMAVLHPVDSNEIDDLQVEIPDEFEHGYDGEGDPEDGDLDTPLDHDPEDENEEPMDEPIEDEEITS